MTGSSDDYLDEGSPDPLDPLLRPPVDYLPVPPGSFDRIRRRAARRRRTRAVFGGTVAVAVLTGSLYLVGSLTGQDSDADVAPPASSGQSTASTPPPATTPRLQSASPLPPPPVTGQTPSSPGASHTGSTGSATTPTSGSADPMCATSQLTPKLGGGDGAAGSLFRYLVLTNHSKTTCHVAGYPGLSMLDSKGGLIGKPATRQTIAYTPVVLRPGASASDTIHTVNQQGTCLPTSVSLRIYPPGNKASLVFPGQLQNCFDTFSVTPFIAGSTGNPRN